MIDWVNVARAIVYYEGAGYPYREVPWIVEPAATQVTLPKGLQATSTRQGDLVGSAEQSFIQEVMLAQRLPTGRHLAATPCFRDEPTDALHQKYFFKVELIEVYRKQADESWAQKAYGHMMLIAQQFFKSIVPNPHLISTEPTADGRDITYRGIELGSYGIRRHQDWTWVYGTGYADPRFCYAISRP